MLGSRQPFRRGPGFPSDLSTFYEFHQYCPGLELCPCGGVKLSLHEIHFGHLPPATSAANFREDK